MQEWEKGVDVMKKYESTKTDLKGYDNRICNAYYIDKYKSVATGIGIIGIIQIINLILKTLIVFLMNRVGFKT
jgi:hypothetical protein